MEENLHMEQPNTAVSETEQVSEPITNKEINSTNADGNSGSMFGKFKDATSLLDAYNNLQKEFTRKSQKLSEMTKQLSTLEDEKTQNTSLKDEKTPQIFNANAKKYNFDNLNKNSFNEKQTKNPAELNNKSEADTIEPIYKKSNWLTIVNQFFKTNPDAKQYSSEISKILLSDKTLANNNRGLEYAYALVNMKHQVKPAELINDPKYFADIIADERVKEKIIVDYLQNISKSKTNIKVISGEPNYISPTPTKDKPKNLKEASNMLRKLLQS